jgi:hypothetical protein
MTLLHYGIRGGPPTILDLVFVIVGVIFFAFIGIATKGFKDPHKKEGNK